MPNSRAYVSPYLLRPCRSLKQARRDMEKRARTAVRSGSRGEPEADPERNSHDDTPHNR